jgi:lysophospholipase L1-like esterase
MFISASCVRSLLRGGSRKPFCIKTGTVRSSYSTESSSSLPGGDSHRPATREFMTNVWPKLQAVRFPCTNVILRYIVAIDRDCITNSASLRLMPLGGSITYGVGSSDKNGYRKFLYDMLTSDGHVVEMVGSRKSGTMSDNWNEGWRGFTIDQIERKARISVPLLKPNLVTINAGSNDCLQNLEVGQIGNRISRLLEYIWSASSGSTVILSTLLLNSNASTEQRILEANAQFEALALQKGKQQKKIIFVDMHGADGPSADELVDGTHPSDSA